MGESGSGFANDQANGFEKRFFSEQITAEPLTIV
jgi:hypothetical protein